MQLVESALTCVSVMNARIVTFMIMNPHNSPDKPLILIWSMIGK